MRPLERLLVLADLDAELVVLRHRAANLEVRRALDALDVRVSEVATERGSLASLCDEALVRQRAAEGEANAIDERRRGIEAKLLAARGTPARELQAMNDEIGHLRERQGEFEEQALKVMEEVEPLVSAIDALDAKIASLESDRPALLDALASSEAEVKAEIDERISRRTQALEGLDQDLLDHYARVGAKYGGVGAARLVGARCAGCHLELPSMEVERLRRLGDDEIATCDSCGRILVVESSNVG